MLFVPIKRIETKVTSTVSTAYSSKISNLKINQENKIANNNDIHDNQHSHKEYEIIVQQDNSFLVHKEEETSYSSHDYHEFSFRNTFLPLSALRRDLLEKENHIENVSQTEAESETKVSLFKNALINKLEQIISLNTLEIKRRILKKNQNFDCSKMFLLDNAEFNKLALSGRSSKYSVFMSNTIPEISITDYINRVINNSDIQSSTIILIGIYIDKFCSYTNTLLCIKNVYR